MFVISMKKRVTSALLCAICLLPVTSWAEIAVIVNSANANAMTATDISRIFLGKKKSFPDGSSAIPVDQQEGTPIRETFVGTVLKKNEQQLKSYWAQRLFTGKGTPPKVISSSAEIKKLVAENPAIIGYIDSSELDNSVKAIYKF